MLCKHKLIIDTHIQITEIVSFVTKITVTGYRAISQETTPTAKAVVNIAYVNGKERHGK